MINFNQYLCEASARNKILTQLAEEQLKQDNITNWIISENEDGEEIIVAKFLREEEEDGKQKSFKHLSGVMHELLVGKHLNGGQHMLKHENDKKESPEEAHDKIKKDLDTHYPGQYDRINKRAKSAAEDLKKHFDNSGHTIKHVHWVSKAGDIARSTGGKFDLTQNQDKSDIMVHSHHMNESPKHVKFTGISLKKSENNTPEVHASSLGIETAGPKAASLLKKHREDLLKDHPEIDHIKASDLEHKPGAKKPELSDARAAWLKKQPKEVAKKIKDRNVATLRAISAASEEHLNSLSKEQLADHVKKVLAGKNSPMHGVPVGNGSKESHESIKHITYGSKDNTQHKTIGDVSKNYSHIFDNPKVVNSLRAEARGGSVHFYHTDENGIEHKTAEQATKFTSQSDPLSAVSTAGKEGKPTNPNAKPRNPRVKKAVVSPTPAPKWKPAPPPSPGPVPEPKPTEAPRPRLKRKPRIFRGDKVTSRRLTVEQIRFLLQQIRESRYA